MRPLNLQEAAQFLRMSRSSLYQRKDIPRYRRPGSRTLLFDQEELEAWVRTGRVEPMSGADSAGYPHLHTSSPNDLPIRLRAASAIHTLDIQNADIYHRNPRYR